MPSQYGEDQHVLRYFEGRIGSFLDIGAFDGSTYSNTAGLVELGWNGVLVEPSPPAFCWLMKRYMDNPRLQLVNAAVVPSAQAGEIVHFHVNTPNAFEADAMSSFKAEHIRKFKDHPFREIRIAGISWGQLLEGVGHRHDFVNIDVEGLNWELLEEMPFDPQMVCIEMDPNDKVEDMMKLFHAKGLTEQRCIGGNLLASRPL